MSEEYQIHIPPSFSDLYLDGRRRLTISQSDLRDRYEVCEDLANHLVTHCQGIHVEVGVDEQEVLQRCYRGLCTPESGVMQTEARWVVTRLAELLGWSWPEFDPDEEEL